MAALSSRQARRNKAQGYDVEARARKELEQQGYWVERMYGSRGTFDIIACRGLVTRLIQIKSSKQFHKAPETVRNVYKDDIHRMELIEFHSGIREIELWVWFGKQKNAGEKGYRPAGWRKFYVAKDMIIEYEEETP